MWYGITIGQVRFEKAGGQLRKTDQKQGFVQGAMILMIGTVTNAVVLYLMFSAPPALNGSGLVAYAAVTYILWGVTYTMMDIPFWSMIPAFTHSGKEREGLSTLGRSCAGVGSAIITVITMLCVNALGGGEERVGFSRFTLIIAVLFVIFITVTCINIKEKSTVDVDAPSIGQMFKALIQNDQAMAVVITIVLINCAVYTTSNLVIYFFKYDFSPEAWQRYLVQFLYTVQHLRRGSTDSRHDAFVPVTS